MWCCLLLIDISDSNYYYFLGDFSSQNTDVLLPTCSLDFQFSNDSKFGNSFLLKEDVTNNEISVSIGKCS